MYQQYGARGSALTVAPFNGGSLQDVEALVAYVYDQPGWDIARAWGLSPDTANSPPAFLGWGGGSRFYSHACPAPFIVAPVAAD